jgi:hypothetical protein
MSGNTDQIFEMHTTGPTGTFAAIPAGTILELEMDYVPNSGEALGAFIALATCSLGFIYFPVLDNQNFKVWYPIGLSSTVWVRLESGVYPPVKSTVKVFVNTENIKQKEPWRVKISRDRYGPLHILRDPPSH